jgi:hypothetical protein
MASRATPRSFSGSVYSLVSAGNSGQEILHIRAVDGDGDNVDLEFDVANGKILAETLRLRVDRDRNLIVRIAGSERALSRVEVAAL